MELANLVLEYLRVLVWPILVVVLVVLLRHRLVQLLARLTQASLPGGVDLSFSQEAREAVSLSDLVESKPKENSRRDTPGIPLTEANARMLNLGLRPSPSGLDLSYYRDLADQDPNIALAGLRMEIETIMQNVAKGFGLASRPKEPASRTIRRLLDAGHITPQQARLADSVLQLCNKAVHGIHVSREEANWVIDASKALRDDYLNWLSWGFPDGWSPLTEQED
jgi:hypothetical protein